MSEFVSNSRSRWLGSLTYAIASILAPAFGGAIYQFNRDLVWYVSIGIGVVILAGAQWLHVLLRSEATRDFTAVAKSNCDLKPVNPGRTQLRLCGTGYTS